MGLQNSTSKSTITTTTTTESTKLQNFNSIHFDTDYSNKSNLNGGVIDPIEMMNLKYDSIKSIKSISYNFKWKNYLCRARYFGLYKQYIISDCKYSRLKLIDIDGNYINSVNPNSIFKCPWAIYINKSNEIFVSDCELGIIVVLSSQFLILRHFGANKVGSAECITIDEDSSSDEASSQQPPSNNNLLYAADYDNNLITIWNSMTGDFVNEFEIKSPCDIGVYKNKIFVTSENNFSYCDPERRKLDTKTLVSDNCIYVFDKKNLNLLNKIKLNDWLAPICLYFDVANKQLITLAFHIYNENSVSIGRYLYLIDLETYKCKHKVNLNIDRISDMCVVDKKILLVRGPYEPSMYIVEF